MYARACACVRMYVLIYYGLSRVSFNILMLISAFLVCLHHSPRPCLRGKQATEQGNKQGIGQGMACVYARIHWVKQGS